MLRNRSRLLAGGIFFLALLVITVSFLARHVAVENVRAFASLAHTHSVLAEIDLAINTLLDAEAATRGYILTGSEEYLEPYHRAQTALPAALQRIKLLTSDNPTQQTNSVLLERLATQRLSGLTKAVQTRTLQGFDAALAWAKKGRGKRVMDEVRATSAAMKREEFRLLSSRQLRSQRYSLYVKSAANCFLLLGIGLLALVIGLVKRLRRLENLVTVCAWTQSVRYAGRWVPLEEFLLEEFDIETTHGISDSAAAQMMAQIEADPADTPVTPTSVSER